MKKFSSILFALVIISACWQPAVVEPPSRRRGSCPTQFAVYALNSEPLTNWDPAIEFSNGIHVHNNMYEQLLRYDARGQKGDPAAGRVVHGIGRWPDLDLQDSRRRQIPERRRP